jgi:hypothetical protein
MKTLMLALLCALASVAFYVWTSQSSSAPPAQIVNVVYGPDQHGVVCYKGTYGVTLSCVKVTAAQAQ